MFAFQEIDVQNKKAIVISVPVPQLKAYQKIQTRLVRELEKKFSGKHVIFIAQVTSISVSCVNKYLNLNALIVANSIDCRCRAVSSGKGVDQTVKRLEVSDGLVCNMFYHLSINLDFEACMNLL